MFRGHALAQLVEALRYKAEDRGFIPGEVIDLILPDFDTASKK
jgi:hypothetical protein